MKQLCALIAEVRNQQQSPYSLFERVFLIIVSGQNINMYYLIPNLGNMH